MPGTPKISVIVTNYNKGKYIRAAIDSVLDQTFTDFEIIIVDDASTDDSLKTIKECCDRTNKIRLIIHDERRGSAAARNSGIKNSNGQIICFLDSDDIYSQDKLQKQIVALQEEPTPVVVYSNWWRIDENGNTLPPGKRDHPTKSGRIFSDCLTHVFGSSTMFMIPKLCFDKVGLYDESLMWAEDYDLVLRLARNFDFIYVNLPLYGYRTHEGNKRNLIKRKERLFSEALVTEKYYRENKELLNEESKKKVVSLLIRYFSLTGQRRKVLRYGLSSLSAFRFMLSSMLTNRPIK
ncbi:MAG TPA: glycosyltransferase [Nitrososphaerales archaeon]|nr:glycosyltransferase [Nitrososphaerales archaeon]